MINLETLLGKIVIVELPGKLEKTGYLVDYGDDVLVLYEGRQYLYIPFQHIQHLRQSLAIDTNLQQPDATQIGNQTPQITFRQMLTHALGRFIEVWAAGKQPLFGTLIQLQDDYLVLESPVYKTLYLALAHLKWLVPYADTHVPYALPPANIAPAQGPAHLPPTFAELVQRMVGSLVVFDAGEVATKSGLLQTFNQNNILELIAADGQKMYWNLQHLKTVHLP